VRVAGVTNGVSGFADFWLSGSIFVIPIPGRKSLPTVSILMLAGKKDFHLPSLNHSKQPLAVTDDDNNDESLKNRHYCKAMFMLPILIIMVSTRIS